MGDEVFAPGAEPPKALEAAEWACARRARSRATNRRVSAME
jgi:hypothetical protein